MNTFDTGLSAASAQAFALTRTPDFEFDLSEVVHLEVTVREVGKGSTHYAFTVAGNKVMLER